MLLGTFNGFAVYSEEASDGTTTYVARDKAGEPRFQDQHASVTMMWALTTPEAADQILTAIKEGQS